MHRIRRSSSTTRTPSSLIEYGQGNDRRNAAAATPRCGRRGFGQNDGRTGVAEKQRSPTNVIICSAISESPDGRWSHKQRFATMCQYPAPRWGRMGRLGRFLPADILVSPGEACENGGPAADAAVRGGGPVLARAAARRG